MFPSPLHYNLPGRTFSSLHPAGRQKAPDVIFLAEDENNQDRNDVDNDSRQKYGYQKDAVEMLP
ncbi:MAG: hypothetical protein KAJ15_12540 [Spirochaetes bacterium]|nr:hypothetical protein [Spirochaetota bacterium]